jgi:hypothetical protein
VAPTASRRRPPQRRFAAAVPAGAAPRAAPGRQRSGDEEDRLDAVDDVASRQIRAAVGRARPRARGEHGAEDRRADGAAEGAEEAGGGGGDAELAPVDGVLHGHHQDLRDHPEPEAEHREADAGGDTRSETLEMDDHQPRWADLL